MVRAAGFRVVAGTGLYFVPLGAGHPRPAAREHVRDALTPAGRDRLVARWRGVPHTALRAAPA